MSVLPRLKRLFGADGRCFAVAMDHGIHNEPSFLPGIKNLKQTVTVVATAGPDAILLSPGQADFLQHIAGREKPSLIMRADPTNLYNIPTPKGVFCQLLDDAVEQALALDAAAVLVNLLCIPDRPGLYHQSLENVSRVKPKCKQYGLPLMVEALALIPNKQRPGFRSNPDIRAIVALVRQAVELGADILKVDPSENLQQYRNVIEVASPKPVLVRGGSRVTDNKILSRIHAVMQLGAAGIVYGRNIYQHPHVEKMVRACDAIIHKKAGVPQAKAILTENQIGRI